MDVVDRQVEAYNARDVDAFVACYSEGVVVEDARGKVLMRGHDGLRAEYEPFFVEYPDLHAAVCHRVVIGEYVVDEEEITGWQADAVRAVAIYHVAGDRLDHVRLIG